MRVGRVILGMIVAALAGLVVWMRTETQAANAASAPGGPAWVFISNPGGVNWSVDTTRIEKMGRATQVWLRYDYPAPQTFTFNRAVRFSRVEMQESLDCQAESVTDVRMRVLDDHDGIVAEPVWSSTRSFAGHPIGRTFPVVCAILDARRRGVMRAELDTLRMMSVPVAVPHEVGVTGPRPAPAAK